MEKGERGIVALVMVGAALVFIGMCACGIGRANATEYKSVQVAGTPCKVGKYYFKQKKVGYRSSVYFSKKRGSGYKKTPIRGYNFVTNGKTAYYMKSGTLYRYSLAKRKVKKLAKVRMSKYAWAYTTMVYSGNVYLTRADYGNDLGYRTFHYNLKTKKLHKDGTYDIVAHSGKYAVIHTRRSTDVTPSPQYLCKSTTSGLKRIKRLGKYGNWAVFGHGQLYFDSYPSVNMRTMYLCKCKKNGKAVKRFKTIKLSKKQSLIFAQKLTPDYCIYVKEGSSRGYYLYTYRTKETTLIAYE